MHMDKFRVGAEIHRTRELGFESRKRRIKSFSKIDETTLSSGIGLAITMVIPTVGCTWALSKSGGCSMCGYINDSTLDPETDAEYYFDLEWQKLQEDPRFKDIKAVKLYNSGSFLDQK
jgi:radical SAM enzyme (TIGR01210 family)